MKWIVTATAIGWAGIVALAWRLADERAQLCYYIDDKCKIAALATRDATLTSGLTVALVAGAGFAFVALARSGRLNLRPGQAPASTSSAERMKRLR